MKTYDMTCKKMTCRMSYQACIHRQQLPSGSRTVFFATRMECNGCRQGAEVFELHGIEPIIKRKCSECDSPDVVCKGMCKLCYNRITAQERREKRR